MSRTYRDRFNRINGALGTLGNGKKCLVMILSAGSHEQTVAAARGWTVTSINVTTGGVWPSRATVAEYDLLVVDAGYNGIDGTSAVNAANAYSDGVSVYSTGNDTTAMSPLFTGTASNGTDKDILPSGSHFLSSGWPTHFDGDNGLYLTGVNGGAVTFAVTNGTPRPLGVAMENPLTGARWVHLQTYSNSHDAQLDNAIYGWLAMNSWQTTPTWEAVAGSVSVVSNEAVASAVGTAIAAIPIGARSNDSCDMFVQAVAEHVYGSAVYARVVDANNWIRALVRSYQSSYQYYITEYYHPNYVTEYYWTRRANVTEYQYQYDNWVYGTWSGWNNYSVSNCVTSPSNVSIPSGNDTTEFQLGSSAGTAGCASGRQKWNVQRRTRTKTNFPQTCWSSTGACNGGTATGQTRVVCGSNYGTPYWAQSAQNSCDTQTANRQTDIGGTWDTNSAGSTNTRQAGPYTGYTTYQGAVTLQKCVGGGITQLGIYEAGSTSAATIRLECEGSALRVYRQGSLVISATDAAHQLTGTKAGVGGGTSEYNGQAGRTDDFIAGGINPERVKFGGVLVPMNRKIMFGGVLVDFDTVVK